MKSTPLLISNLVHTGSGGLSRVSAHADGHEVWFETRDALLSASPEAFVCFFLLQAMASGRPLEIDAPLDALFLANLAKLMPVFQSWWGFAPVEVRGKGTASGEPALQKAPGLFFTGGVDSFFSLFECKPERKPGMLVFVHGFDIRLDDTWRAENYRHDFNAVSAAVDLPAVCIRTNLREHPVFDSLSWEMTHGSALAGCSHLLSAETGRMVIASSYPYMYAKPWGSHWETDPLWSGARMEILHDGADFWRSQKIRRIAARPLVQKYLRVCWVNRAGMMNCGWCEKCIRTRIVLKQVGEETHYKIFAEHPVLHNFRHLVEELVLRLPDGTFQFYEEIGDYEGGDPEATRAARGVVLRSRFLPVYLASRARVFFRKLRRRTLRELRKIIGSSRPA